ncbi:tripartite tricarboxylate transporter TctB family protein [Ahrensia kielensis]|uniref:Tripartite tricarboxylate transporter TctB family protein n=1 Tax=Ahrensia kielensis TaxID=76980 RepID=A0ABU9T2M0_9HYPH
MARKSDRFFGLVVILGAFAYIAGALQIQTSFLTDPVGAKTFPILVASIAAICGCSIAWRPDEEPGWPSIQTLLSLVVSVALLCGYALALKPFGFIIPTALTAGILSYQISPRPAFAIVAGIGLSVGLFVLFKIVLGLGLVAFPKNLLG